MASQQIAPKHIKANRSDFNSNIFKGVAHRGLFDNKDYTENGLKAFNHAIESNLCFELDIHLTKDDELIVCHDSDLKRTTGKEGVIEYLTAKLIRENYRLLDGGVVPTLQEVLTLNNEKQTVVVELKPDKLNYEKLANKTMEVLSKVKDKKSVTLISFEPKALMHCNGGFFTRGLLIGNEEYKKGMKLLKDFEYLDIDSNLLHREEVKKYRQEGGIVNAWTINNEATFKAVKPFCDIITFDHLSPEFVTSQFKEKEDSSFFLSQK